MQSHKSNYNKQCLTKMNRQTKQRRGRLWWSDDRGVAVADAYLPSISNIRHHHHTKVEGQPLLKEDFCKFSYSNIQRVFQHLSHSWWERWAWIDGSQTPWCFSIDPSGSTDRRYQRPSKHMHLIARRAWENHFLRSPVEKQSTSCSVAEWWTAHSLAGPRCLC